MFVDWFDATTGAPRVRPVWHEVNALLQALDRPVQHASPEIRVHTDEGALRLEVVAPGVRAEDVTATVTGRRLDFAMVRELAVPEGYTAVRQERRGWRLERSFELPFDVDASAATATLDAGVFTLTLPRVPAAQSVRIPVRGRAQAAIEAESAAIEAESVPSVSDSKPQPQEV